MSGYERTDFEWGVIQPWRATKPRGAPRGDDRRVLNGMFRVLRTGAPWRATPSRFGPRTTWSTRFVRWRKAGVFTRIMAAITKAYNGDAPMIDSTSVRVHPHAANSKKTDPDRCLGRARGGLTTKIHALTDARGVPLAVVLTPGQAAECPQGRPSPGAPRAGTDPARGQGL